MVFDEEAPGPPLVGTAPPTSSFDKLNLGRAGGATVVLGKYGAPWVVFADDGELNAVSLTPPFRRQSFGEAASNATVRYRAIYFHSVVQPTPTAPKRLVVTVETVGDPTGGVRFDFPPDPYVLLINSGGGDDVFVYWSKTSALRTFEIHRRDLAYERTLPFPDGLDPAEASTPPRFLLSPDGRWLLVLDGNDELTIYDTLSEDQRALPVVDLLDVDADFADGYLVAYTAGGLYRFAADAAATSDALRLDEFHCRPVGFDADAGVVTHADGGSGDGRGECPVSQPLWVVDGKVYYLVGDELRRVDVVTPSAPTVVAHGTHRLVDVGFEEVVVSHDLTSPNPALTYTAGASDGWIGDWNFMERGRDIRWSHDGHALRFLEHAAQSNGIGALRSVANDPRNRPTPRTLALNVRQFDELDDGRLLAVENHAFNGTQERLVAIDEAKNERRWVAAAAHRYQLIPGDPRHVVVDVVTGATGYDIYRVPLP